jgi:hypothetical protein
MEPGAWLVQGEFSWHSWKAQRQIVARISKTIKLYFGKVPQSVVLAKYKKTLNWVPILSMTAVRRRPPELGVTRRF